MLHIRPVSYATTRVHLWDVGWHLQGLWRNQILMAVRPTRLLFTSLESPQESALACTLKQINQLSGFTLILWSNLNLLREAYSLLGCRNERELGFFCSESKASLFLWVLGPLRSGSVKALGRKRRNREVAVDEEHPRALTGVSCLQLGRKHSGPER